MDGSVKARTEIERIKEVIRITRWAGAPNFPQYRHIR